MPHVLVELQGLQKPVFKNEKDASKNDHMVLDGHRADGAGRDEAGGV